MEQILSNSKKSENILTQIIAPIHKKERNFILISIFFAFLIRLILIPNNSTINGDGIYYARLGQKIFSGDFYGGISGYWSPFYSFIVGFSSLFFRDLEFAGRIASIFAGTLLIIPAYLLIRNFYGRNSAYLGTILLIIHPSLLKSSGWVMTESVFTLIFTTVLLVGWYALRNGKAIYFFITGLLWGIAYLTKPEAIGFLGLLFLLTIFAKFFRQNISWRCYLTGYFLILLGFFFFFAPYIIFLKQKTGQWTISQKIMVNLPAMDYEKGLLNITDDGQITMQDRIWGDHYEIEIKSSTTSTENSPKSFNSSKLQSDMEVLGKKGLFLLRKQFRDYIPALLPFPLILIALVGFFYKPWTKYRAAREFYLLSFFICMLLGYAFSAVELRYLFPLIPILIAWVSNGLIEFSDWASITLSNLLRLNKKLKHFTIQISVSIVFTAMLVSMSYSQIESTNFQNVPFEEKQAGLWLKNNTNIPSLIMSSNATPAFYANSDHLYLPNEDFSTVLEYAKRKQVNYIVFSERRIRSTPKAFPPDNQNIPNYLQLVYQDEPVLGFKITIYKINY